MMLNFGGGALGWLGPLISLGLMVGVVLIVIWAVQTGSREADDEPLRTVRVRFARGEIDAARFEEMQRSLASTEAPRASRRLGLIGLALVSAALVLGMIGSSLGPVGSGWGWGPMMGPGGIGPMMGLGSGPTAPAGTSVRMAGSRFEPATLSVRAGETVRWFNDDALPHTVSAIDGTWDSGDLPPGASFEWRFEAAGTFGYLCRYHPGMAGTITVTG